MKSNPLESRIYKLKNPACAFFCPLCRTERAIKVGSRLTRKNYFQIMVISTLVMMLAYPIFRERIFIFPLFIWVFAEMLVKIIFRSQIPCPHCGFDATWYKRDVKMAKKQVEEFWRKMNKDL